MHFGDECGGLILFFAQKLRFEDFGFAGLEQYPLDQDLFGTARQILKFGTAEVADILH